MTSQTLGRTTRAYGVQAGVLVATVVFLALTVPDFTPSSAVFGTLDGIALIGIAGAGVAVTMIAGELDLSIGSMAALAGVVAIRAGGLGLVPAIALGTATGLVFGLGQGLLIAWLRISSLVVTVGSLIGLSGIALLLAGERPIGLAQLTTTDPLLRQWWLLTPATLTGVAVLVLLGVFLAFTRWGREIYAIGGARQEARAAGVPVTGALTLAFGISGACAGLSGALACLQGASADPRGFTTLLLGAVSACLIGGVSLYGGRGNAVNVVLGVVILGVVSAGATAAGAPTYVTGLVTGALLLLVVGMQFVMDRTVAVRRLHAARARNATAFLGGEQ
ncbi:ABC transporter permease [Amycolatopsis pithecellobii]|uniref:ABC transporter permease n=1 Tax=Amycolatopsis pithecellobii TaxID=664692 RepID=A0A6N7Z425_9PSEU|nr:ABC transporter permease [Amycolatopsis pithecellobii]MTD55111.1 ABC transporter permease [Amycolatopsis pithecellobii]